VLNYALRDGDVWHSEGIASRILSALVGCEQLPSPSWRFTPYERFFHFLADGWVGPQLVWTLSRTESPSAPPRIVPPYISDYTD
jgi:hypothetical protein